MSTEITTPRIYVASLSDYNGGKLHGVWIDATDEIDDVWQQIKDMLAASPEFKEFPQGGPAEEWAIHDSEGFGGYRVGEYDNIEELVKLAHAIEEHDDAFVAWLEVADNSIGGLEIDDLIERFSECHIGSGYDSEESYAMEYAEEHGIDDTGIYPYMYTGKYSDEPVNVIEALSSYIDWESVTRAMFHHGTYAFVNGHIFDTQRC